MKSYETMCGQVLGAGAGARANVKATAVGRVSGYARTKEAEER